MSDAYKNHSYQVSSSDEISSVDPKTYHRYLEMIAAEKELEEKTLLDVLNEVEEELPESRLSDNIFVHNANKLKEFESNSKKGDS